MESVTLSAIEAGRARRRAVLGALLVLLAGRGCRSIPAGESGSSPDSGELVSVDVGSSFERVCSAEPEGISLVISAVTCTILGDVGRVRANLEASGKPLLAVTYDGLEPGRQSTASDATTDVILLGVCPARAKDSPEPCTVELVELKRAATPVMDGEVEPGSSLTLRVSCPASLTHDGSDVFGTTQQSPQRFEIHAESCVAYD